MEGDELLSGLEDAEERCRLDAIAEVYDAENDFDAVLSRFAFRLIGPRLGRGTVLEMGCSSGVMTAMLAGVADRLEVVDASRRYLEVVSRKVVRKDIVWHESLFESFEPARRFDDVVIARGLEHVVDPVAVLGRTATWLAPGGRLHVVVPNALSLHRLLGVEMGLLQAPGDLSVRDRRFGHRRVYDGQALRHDLEAAGFRLQLVEDVLLKLFPNEQMARLSPEVLEGLFRLSRRFPGHGAEIYALGELDRERRE